MELIVEEPEAEQNLSDLSLADPQEGDGIQEIFDILDKPTPRRGSRRSSHRLELRFWTSNGTGTRRPRRRSTATGGS